MRLSVPLLFTLVERLAAHPHVVCDGCHWCAVAWSSPGDMAGCPGKAGLPSSACQWLYTAASQQGRATAAIQISGCHPVMVPCFHGICSALGYDAYLLC